MIKPLTSLRIVFALMVFLFHLEFFPQTYTAFQSFYKATFSEGYIGVSFFFILSGFVLSLSYQKKFGENRITYRQYLVARIARIYPIHLLTLLFASYFMLGVLKSAVAVFSTRFFASLFLLQSWIPIRTYYFTFNSVSWSISDELFFYVVFPFLLLIAKPKKIWPFFLLAIIPILTYLVPEGYDHWLFYINPLFRVVDFFLGVLLYGLFERNILKPGSKTSAGVLEILAIIVFGAFFLCRGYIPQGYRFSSYYWIPMAFIILTFSYAGGFISKALSNKWLVLGGEISFAFYMTHQLIMEYVLKFSARWGLSGNYYVLSLIMLLLSLAISYFLYRFYEMPMNRFIKQRALAPRGEESGVLSS